MGLEKWTVLGLFALFALNEARRTGFLRKPGARAGDNAADASAFFLTAVLVVPTIFVVVNVGLAALIPDWAGALSHWSFLAQFACFLVLDDLMQYAWHRTAHNWKPLYRLHRAHHETSYMSVRVSYRNNFVYYVFMPSFWLSATLVFLGMGWTYAVFLVIKQLVIFGAHSDAKWDSFLIHRPALHPLLWVLERTISTPSTHHMHHGKHLDDGVTHYKGNYGNLLFLWDVIFGTARITRRYPAAYGTENLKPANWWTQVLSPLGASAALVTDPPPEPATAPPAAPAE